MEEGAHGVAGTAPECVCTSLEHQQNRSEGFLSVLLLFFIFTSFIVKFLTICSRLSLSSDPQSAAGSQSCPPTSLLLEESLLYLKVLA